MEYLSKFLLSLPSGSSQRHHAVLLWSESKNTVNHARRVTDLNTAHIGRVIVVRASKRVGVELFQSRNVATANHVVELRPTILLSNMSHPWVGDDAREV
ncbi:hypothetical protein A2U01_0055746, partial [Trifolium medium]|nr:hypothetical protein [Trifolium medium]